MTASALRWLRTPLLLALCMTILAASCGLRDYQANPEGRFFYTPRNICQEVPDHSFTTTFLAILLACGAATVIVTLVAFVPTLIRSRSPFRAGFERVGRGGLVVLAVVFASTFLSVPAERLLPRATWPGCGASLMR